MTRSMVSLHHLLYRLIICLQVLLIQQTNGIRHCAISSLNIRSTTTSRYARTNVHAVLWNDATTRPGQLCLYKLPLPSDSFISTLVIDLKNERLFGKVEKRLKKKKKNSTQYLESSNRTVANNITIKMENGSQVLRITNLIPRNTSITIIIGYEKLLQRRRGMYELVLFVPVRKAYSTRVAASIIEDESIVNLAVTSVPEIGAPEDAMAANRLKVSVSEDNKQASIQYNIVSRASDKHDQAFIKIVYDVTRQPDGGELQIKDGYFVHFFCPEGFHPIPQHTVFILDTSGSMSADGKMRQLKKAMLQIIQRFSGNDSFEIIVFSTTVTSLGTFNGTPAGIMAGMSQVKNLRSWGSTNINNALLQGIKGANRITRNQQIIKQIMFLTDGTPTVSETDPNKILQNVNKANLQNITIHSLALGTDLNNELLKRLSSENNGITCFIKNLTTVADQLKAFYDEIAIPLISNLEITYPSDQVQPESVIRKKRSIFYSGEEVVTTGKLQDGAFEVTPSVTASGHKGRVQFNVSRVLSPETCETSDVLENSEFSRLWAYMAVKDMLSAQDFIVDPVLRNDLRSRALDIALRYNFVTRFTSLTILEVPRQSNETYYSVLESQDFDILPEEELYSNLPSSFQGSFNTSLSRRYSFVDNDPHFVVHVSGVSLPLCFDIHGKHGDVFSLIRDAASGVIVNGEVGSASGRPNTTYFVRLFISLKDVNITVTPNRIIAQPQDHVQRQKKSTSIWPFNSRLKKCSKVNANDRRNCSPHKRKRRKRKRRRKHRLERSTASSNEEVHLRHKDDSDYNTDGTTNWHHTHDFGIIKSKRTNEQHLVNSNTVVDNDQVHHIDSESRLSAVPQISHVKDTILIKRISSEVEAIERNVTFIENNNKLTFNTIKHTLIQFIKAININLMSKEIMKYSLLQNIYCDNVNKIMQVWTQFVKACIIKFQLIEQNLRVHTALTHNQDLLKEIHYLINRSGKTQHKTNYNCIHALEHLTNIRQRILNLQHLVRQLQYNQKMTAVNEPFSNNTLPAFAKKLSWRKRGGFSRFGDVVITLDRRQLHVVKGDLAVHLTVTHSTSKRGQQFLGFYIQQQNVLSPATTGILGQFVFKSVGVKRSSMYPHKQTTNINDKIDLVVVHPHHHKSGQKVSHVTGFVKRRRSLLHKKKVSCLHVGREGKGLLQPMDYKLPCITC